MARNTLGIYWNEIHIHAALIRSSLTEMAIERIICLPRAIDVEGRPLNAIEHDLRLMIGEMGITPDTVVVGLPEDEVMYRTLMRPFSDRRKIGGTIAPEMETLLPMTEDDLMVDFLVLGRKGTGETLVEGVGVRKASVERVLATCGGAGLEPEIVDAIPGALAAGARDVCELDAGPNYLFTYVGWGYTSLVLLQGKTLRHTATIPIGIERVLGAAAGDGLTPGSLMERAGQEGGLAGGEETDALLREILISLERLEQLEGEIVLVPVGYAAMISDLEARYTEMSGASWAPVRLKEGLEIRGIDECGQAFVAVGLACRGAAGSDGMNFRQGELAYTRGFEKMKAYGYAWGRVLVVLLALWLAGVGLDVYFKDQRRDELDARMRETFGQTMPAGTPMVDPERQLEQYLSRLSGSAPGAVGEGAAAPLEIIRDLSAGISGEIDVVFDTITIDESSISLSGSTQSYDNVERIKGILDDLEYVLEVKIVSANVDKNDQRVKFKLICRKGGA